ncbi:MAG: stage II sporulation protein M [Candidatus Margulisiibacteriota bacterium]
MLALFLFILGFGFSYFVEKFDLKVFKVFPIWFLKQTIRFANPSKSFTSIFLFIFLFNSIAICLYMLSGLLVLFPVLIAFLTGTNIGIIVLHPVPKELKEGSFYRPKPEIKFGPFLLLLTALVPIFELFVFCYSIAMGLEMASSMFLNFTWENAVILAIPRIKMYLMLCAPLLFISALAEARVIKEFK